MAQPSQGPSGIKSTRTYLKFNGTNVIRRQAWYETSFCVAEVFAVISRGDFVVDPKKSTNDGARPINLRFVKATAVAQGPGVGWANQQKLCGRDDWKADEEAEITAAAGSTGCGSATVPGRVFDIYRTERDYLVLGTDALTNNAENQRPTNLSSGIRYRRLE